VTGICRTGKRRTGKWITTIQYVSAISQPAAELMIQPIVRPVFGGNFCSPNLLELGRPMIYIKFLEDVVTSHAPPLYFRLPVFCCVWNAEGLKGDMMSYIALFTSLKLGERIGELFESNHHRLSRWMLHIFDKLLHFEIRARKRRSASKVEAKFVL